MKLRLIKLSEIPILVKLDKITNLTYWNYSDYLSSFYNSSNLIYVLEYEKTKIIGVIVLSIISPEAEILQFWIRDDQKRQGYGKMLLKLIIDLLRMKEVIRLFLEVREDNIAAIKLYTGFGFKTMGRRKNYYTVDAWKYDALTMLCYIK